MKVYVLEENSSPGDDTTDVIAVYDEYGKALYDAELRSGEKLRCEPNAEVMYCYKDSQVYFAFRITEADFLE